MSADPVKAAAESAERIREADDAAHRASVAFASGHWHEYWQAEAEAARQRLEDEWEKSNSGSGGNDTGNGQGSDLAPDD